MKPLLLLMLLIIAAAGCRQAAPQAPAAPSAFEALPFGSVRPLGWLEAQMRADLGSFVGHLPALVPGLFGDSIYGPGRLRPGSAARDLGNLKSGDAEGDEQYQWWNSETQSNGWDAYLRHALLLDSPAELARADRYVAGVLATQDADGYLGIYSPELRYRFQAENGELWAKTTLLRGLLAYAEARGDARVLQAVVRAVEETMRAYPPGASQPFQAGTGFTGGVSHGLTFTDVLDRLHQRTGERRYLDYAVFLYRNFSEHHASEADAQLARLLDPAGRLQAHGVHTYEHLRPLALAAYASGDSLLDLALRRMLARIAEATTRSGGPIGDEWIGGRRADAEIGYEYCSIHELMDSYAQLLRLSGEAGYGDLAETIFYNAAQGARDPEHPAIAYLKTDNSYEMTGTKNGETEPGRVQTRYKYSPVHQDVAVCCAPNAGRIAPYFLQMAWMRQGDALVQALLGPSELRIPADGGMLRIRCETDYPHDLQLRYRVSQPGRGRLTLKIRRPAWARELEASEAWREESGFLVFSREFAEEDSLVLRFSAQPEVEVQGGDQHYFRCGPLLYALPIESVPEGGRIYQPGFQDWSYPRSDFSPWRYVPGGRISREAGALRVELEQPATGRREEQRLVPIGRTALRQAAF
ncbi:MAG: glycoside hydrolase family 127 protein [Bacteroidia bacterium]|nr:glycoside hydrolase family 127 protein [Bacteroidia bacterium]